MSQSPSAALPHRLQAALVALAIPCALWGGALISEYGFGLVPCQLCYWQRWPHEVAIVLALFSLPFLANRAGPVFIFLSACAIAVSGAIGVFHAGVEYGWWQGLTSCTATGGFDMMSATVTPIIRCDVAQWRMFGISLAGFNAIFSFAGAALVLWLLRGKGRSR